MNALKPTQQTSIFNKAINIQQSVMHSLFSRVSEVDCRAKLKSVSNPRLFWFLTSVVGGNIPAPQQPPTCSLWLSLAGAGVKTNGEK